MIDNQLVIENTLNFGIKSSMNRFSITYEQVKEIVKPFTDEIDDGVLELCSCERSRMQGIGMMCWMCDIPNNRRRNVEWS